MTTVNEMPDEQARPPGARVQEVITAAAAVGVDVRPRRYPEGTRTAADAAAAIGCEVADICKSIVLTADDGPVLVLTSGANRVDLHRVADLLGASGLRRATAEEVRSATGQAIGGTAPFGHPTPLRILVDRDLLDRQQIWAAAGTPDTVFPLSPDDLVAATGGKVADVAVHPSR